jgi:hypothetical protein
MILASLRRILQPLHFHHALTIADRQLLLEELSAPCHGTPPWEKRG